MPVSPARRQGTRTATSPVPAASRIPMFASSFSITPDQHQLLKAAAALQGQSIKDYVLTRTLPQSDEQEALQKLEALLKPRINNAVNGNLSTKSIDSIFDEVLKEESKK